MQGHLSELFHDWHDFYLLVGTASATLVGLMFVAASIGASVFGVEHRNAMKAFISPTVVHFAAVMFTCIVITIPSQTWLTLGVLLTAGGLAGVLYSGRILVQLFVRRSFEVDLVDRTFYALIPLVGYVLVLVSGVMLLMQLAASTDVTAAALVVLLLAGIRNAWDMMMWIVFRTPGSVPPPSRQSPP